MYVILCYDIAKKRVAKINKIAKKYLNPIQKSVFEGGLTESSLKRLKNELSSAAKPDEDAITIYCLHNTKNVLREELGIVTKPDCRFL